ncbi:transposase [Mesorhizobium sp. M0146]|uniref:transposase n=1 Tax=unclassified Mesorhizobium TaxID=325217 RepID=UPI00333B49CC
MGSSKITLSIPRDEVADWQNPRPLDPVLSAGLLRRDPGHDRDEVCRSKRWASCPNKEMIGIWIEKTKAKFWLRVTNELKNPGIADILPPSSTASRAFPRQSARSFPPTVQTCIVGLLKNSRHAHSS